MGGVLVFCIVHYVIVDQWNRSLLNLYRIPPRAEVSRTRDDCWTVTTFWVHVCISYSDVISVRPIVRTAFVCASDYDDRTQFHMFEQKKRTGIKKIIQRNSWTFGSPACQKIWEKKFSYLFIAPPKRKHCWTAPDPPLWACWGDVTMPPLLLLLSAHHSANAHDAITLVCVDTARCRGTLWLK